MFSVVHAYRKWKIDSICKYFIWPPTPMKFYNSSSSIQFAHKADQENVECFKETI